VFEAGLLRPVPSLVVFLLQQVRQHAHHCTSSPMLSLKSPPQE
jgi:hypothetical protein